MPQRGASAPRHIGHFVDRTPSRKRLRARAETAPTWRDMMFVIP
jgi:hypothetical protein